LPGESLITRHLLSGHQLKYEEEKLRTRISQSFRSGPPKGGTSRNSFVPVSANKPSPFAFRNNAIQRPSGDHTGLKSRRSSLVSRSGSPEPICCTHRSQFSSFGPLQANTTWVPSGENEGCCSAPGKVVSAVARSGFWSGTSHHSRDCRKTAVSSAASRPTPAQRHLNQTRSDRPERAAGSPGPCTDLLGRPSSPPLFDNAGLGPYVNSEG
jgi:hypothetical protein